MLLPNRCANNGKAFDEPYDTHMRIVSIFWAMCTPLGYPLGDQANPKQPNPSP